MVPTYNKYRVAGGGEEGEEKNSQREKGEEKVNRKNDEERVEGKYSWPT